MLKDTLTMTLNSAILLFFTNQSCPELKTEEVADIMLNPALPDLMSHHINTVKIAIQGRKINIKFPKYY
jgi:hypothetical protein